jgi:NAD+ synthase
MKERIVTWIKKQVRLARVKGIVMGLSGGIDSSVIAALAKQAVGAKRLLALILPCHSQKEDMADALLVARRLGIKTKVIDLSGLYDMFLAALPKGNKLALANLKSRLRMVVFYYFANTLNFLVCGTGNKSELMVGYFTKHGDGATDILPIGDLLKKEVRKLARALDIPERVITKPPTAGLWPGQTDEGEMGLSYPELDEILERLGRKQIPLGAKEKVDRIKKMIAGSEHKRQGPKICYR